MITVPTNPFLLSFESEDFTYINNGVCEFAYTAYKERLRGANDSPAVEDIAAIYQDLIEEEFINLEGNPFEDITEQEWDIREDLIAESIDFLLEFCKKNNLSVCQRIYEEPSFIVKDIYRVVTPQVSLL